MLKKIIDFFKPKQRKYKISFAAIFSDSAELYDTLTITATREKAAKKKLLNQLSKIELLTINRITEI